MDQNYRGTDVALRGTDVALRGTDVALRGTDVALQGYPKHSTFTIFIPCNGPCKTQATICTQQINNMKVTIRAACTSNSNEDKIVTFQEHPFTYITTLKNQHVTIEIINVENNKHGYLLMITLKR